MKKTICLFFILALLGSKLFAQTTGDPWIKKVYNDTWGRDPVGVEWNINNYVNGHWKDYTELMKAVYEWRKNMAAQGVNFKYSEKTYNNNLVAVLFQNGVQMAASIISTNGGGIVASGGGNIVASGAGNIVASGGGNITIKPDSKGFTIGSSFSTLAIGGIKLKTSGSGAILIQ